MAGGFMEEKVLGITQILLLLCVLTQAFSVLVVREGSGTIIVPDHYETIQEAVNAAVEGETIDIMAGTYYEHVVVNKSVSLIGENKSTTVIDGNKAGTVVLVAADSVLVRGFTVRNGKSGIYVVRSSNVTVADNLVMDNRERGILISNSQSCIVSRNYAKGTKPGYGININASSNIIIEGNGATSNYYDGIGLFSSNSSIVRGNTVGNNQLFGIYIDSSSNNTIYHNNFFSNGKQASSNTQANVWDNGVEGNYWGDYAGEDANRDGIGDDPYIVDEYEQQKDNKPLMRPYVNEVYLSMDIEPPVASFTYFPEDPFVNETVSFDASDSYDSVGKGAIVYYLWDFGDGITRNTTEPMANHTYLAGGNFTVSLAAVDVAGNKGSVSSNVQVKLETVTNGFPFLHLMIGVSLGAVISGVVIFAFWQRKKRKLSS